MLEVDLIPAQGAQLGDAQPVAVGDPDHRGIAGPVPVLPSGGDQALDFLGGQVLAGAELGLGHWLWRNCPILRSWHSGSGRIVRHRMRALTQVQLSHVGAGPTWDSFTLFPD